MGGKYINQRQRLAARVGCGALALVSGVAGCSYLVTKSEAAQIFAEPVAGWVMQVDEVLLKQNPDVYIDVLTNYIVDNPDTELREEVSDLVRAVDSADLVVSDIVWSPLVPVDGEVVVITACVGNVGFGNTSRSFRVGFYVDGSVLSYVSVNGLAVGDYRVRWVAVLKIVPFPLGVRHPTILKR